jgi:hypothetical protein
MINKMKELKEGRRKGRGLGEVDGEGKGKRGKG